jgi:hypothetical protein
LVIGKVGLAKDDLTQRDHIVVVAWLGHFEKKSLNLILTRDPAA